MHRNIDCGTVVARSVSTQRACDISRHLRDDGGLMARVHYLSQRNDPLHPNSVMVVVDAAEPKATLDHA